LKLSLNNQEVEISNNTHLNNALIHWGYTQTHFAVAINNVVIPRSEYANIILKHDDRVMVIVPMQGG
jgi:sulfur carrier protein